MVKTPPKKVFWGGFTGYISTFSQGVWTLRAIYLFIVLHVIFILFVCLFIYDISCSCDYLIICHYLVI